jgi:16S rRNA (cytosine967-C5)-methyltransferase
LRVNTFKAKRTDVQKALQLSGIKAVATPYSPWGLRIAGKPALNKHEAFVRGDFEVQDEGSQLLAMLVDAKRGEMVVDFCAGAGGKTLALGASMRSTVYTVSAMVARSRGPKPRCSRKKRETVASAGCSKRRVRRTSSEQASRRAFGCIG